MAMSASNFYDESTMAGVTRISHCQARLKYMYIYAEQRTRSLARAGEDEKSRYFTDIELGVSTYIFWAEEGERRQDDVSANAREAQVIRGAPGETSSRRLSSVLDYSASSKAISDDLLQMPFVGNTA